MNVSGWLIDPTISVSGSIKPKLINSNRIASFKKKQKTATKNGHPFLLSLMKNRNPTATQMTCPVVAAIWNR